MIQIIQSGSSEQPDEILAATSDLVPTGLDDSLAASPEAEVDWQTAMRRAVRSAGELRRRLGLNADSAAPGAEKFPTFVPLEFLSRMRPGDADDPLLRQVLPVADELSHHENFVPDPVGDLTALAADGVLQKYQGRALVIATGACGVHCRYCFRREFPYSSVGSRSEHWQPSIDYIRGHETIDEVIMSGGDPLTLVDHQLYELIDAIESIPHVRRLRIHTRMPIVIPQRITQPLLSRLAASRLAVWMVVHANHPNELDASVLQRLGAIVDAGIPTLNQSVLLRGVNDDADTLIQLCRILVDHRVQPYYLHQLDRVRGAAHFEVPEQEGLRLVESIRASLPGYAVPTYVAERSGQPSKSPIA